jgi:hypothetical protein
MQAMTNEKILRLGLVSASVALMTYAVGCSDDSGSAAPVADAGPSDAASVVDASNVDAASVGDAGAATDAGAAPAGDIVVDIVHAAPDVPAVGLCLAAVVANAPQFIAPFDKVQGPLPRYAGTQLTIPSALQTAIANVPVRVYLVPGYAPGDAGAPSCASVVGNATTVLLNELPAGTFQVGKGYIVAATGCANTATGTVTKCGADAVNPSNPRGLGAWVKTFDRSKIGAGEFGAQVVHLSPQLQGTAFPVPNGDGGTALVPIFAQGVKLALGTPVQSAQGLSYAWKIWASGASPLKFADDPSAKATLALGDAGSPNTFALGLFTAAASTSTPPASGEVLYVPLQFAAAATLGPTNPLVPSYFVDGLTYTFFAVGDPAQSSNPQAPNAGPDFVRILAFPNNARPAAPAGDASAN